MEELVLWEQPHDGTRDRSKLATDIEQLVDLGLVESNDDFFTDFDNGHAHLAAHPLHVASSHRVARNIDLLEFDIVGAEVFHGPFAPTASGRGKNQDFRLLFLFDYVAFFLDLNGHSVDTCLRVGMVHDKPAAQRSLAFIRCLQTIKTLHEKTHSVAMIYQYAIVKSQVLVVYQQKIIMAHYP